MMWFVTVAHCFTFGVFIWTFLEIYGESAIKIMRFNYVIGVLYGYFIGIIIIFIYFLGATLWTDEQTGDNYLFFFFYFILCNIYPIPGALNYYKKYWHLHGEQLKEILKERKENSISKN